MLKQNKFSAMLIQSDIKAFSRPTVYVELFSDKWLSDDFSLQNLIIPLEAFGSKNNNVYLPGHLSTPKT